MDTDELQQVGKSTVISSTRGGSEIISILLKYFSYISPIGVPGAQYQLVFVQPDDPVRTCAPRNIRRVGEIIGNCVDQYAVFDLERSGQGNSPHSIRKGVGQEQYIRAIGIDDRLALNVNATGYLSVGSPSASQFLAEFGIARSRCRFVRMVARR
jgi:hypothetical protein